MTDDLPAVVEPAEVEELLPVREENAKAWEAIEKSKICDRMKRSLRRVATGEYIRDAAAAEDYGDHKNLWSYCKRYGLANSRTARIMDGNRRIANLANDLLEGRLVETPDDISMRDLSVASGIAQDKIAKKERWGQEEATTGVMEALGSVAAKIIKAGGTVEARLTTGDGGEATLSIGKDEAEPIDGEIVDA